MIVIAHNIRSLHNVGSIFRSCDAFGVEKLYLTGITGAPPRKEIAKVALGSEHQVAWKQVEDVYTLIAELKSEGHRVLALENGVNAHPIDSITSKDKVALILGNEVSGIEPELLRLCDVVLEIPMIGRKQSLNVSVAAGIALFALTRQSR